MKKKKQQANIAQVHTTRKQNKTLHYNTKQNKDIQSETRKLSV